MSALNARRLWALCRKESFQIVRDPSSILVAFVLPVILLFVMGYAINLDADHIRIGLLVEDSGPAAVRLEQTLRASQFFEVHSGPTREILAARLAHGEIRAMVIVRDDFTAKLKQGQGGAAIQLVTDGAEPNTASFIGAYLLGAFDTWQQGLAADLGTHTAPVFKLRLRSWFNPSNVSRNFLVPGSIAVVMTIIGALLTSLVVAREWERGTMEALLATPVTKTELLVSKVLPYYVLGMTAMIICLGVSVFIMGIPFRGSLAALFGLSTLFLGCALGNGLFLSTVMRSQFNAALAALTSAFLPAMMLSGFVFEIGSMPMVLQLLTRILPARYFASSLQTLFQAGTVGPLLWTNALGLALLMAFWLGLTARKTKRNLD